MGTVRGQGLGSGAGGGGQTGLGAYLVHAAYDLLELGGAVHEGAAPALGETGGWGERGGRTPLYPRCPGRETEAQRPRWRKGGCQATTFLYTRSMGHPTLMSTKSTSMVRFRSSAHLVMVSGKAPSSCARWQGRGQGPDQAVPSWMLPTGALEPLASSSLNWL